MHRSNYENLSEEVGIRCDWLRAEETVGHKLYVVATRRSILSLDLLNYFGCVLNNELQARIRFRNVDRREPR